MEGQQYSGVVKCFRGSFGFLVCEQVSDRFEGRDVFLHRRAIDRLPCVGDVVQFHLAIGDDGRPVAANATAIGGVEVRRVNDLASSTVPAYQQTRKDFPEIDTPPAKRQCVLPLHACEEDTRVRAALYFGSFDPLHENHFRVCLTAINTSKVRRVYLVPNPNGNPFKPDCSPLSLRKACILERIREAEKVGDIAPGQIAVREVESATNWPEREKIAREVERELAVATSADVAVVFLLGEDSFLKSLQQAAGKHENTGIFQVRRSHRRIIVFPRAGNVECVTSRIPERLKDSIQVAAYHDLVTNLSSTDLRRLLKNQGEPPPPNCLHPVVWKHVLQQAHDRGNVCNNGTAAKSILKKPSATSRITKKSVTSAQPVDSTGAVVCSDRADPRLHYDTLVPQSLDRRLESPSVRIRNFNTFAKAVLIQRFLSSVRKRTGGDDFPLSVLDLGCGKGGDFLKFANGRVTEYCGVDNSAVSLQEHVARVVCAASETRHAKHGDLGETGFPFREITLIRADCWRDHLVPAWDNLSLHATRRLEGLNQTWFHLVSSQFACHYAFESEASLEMLLRNVSERLCGGGVFFGTVPDAARIVGSTRWDTSNGPKTGNSFYDIEFYASHWDTVARDLEKWLEPGFRTVQNGVFGLKYRFRLTDAVDQCYEPLVHFGTFEHTARRYGLVLEMAPTPLFELVVEARKDGSAKAELGRLERILYYKGGLDCAPGSSEEEVLRLYVAFAFRKEDDAAVGMNCKQLSDYLQSLHAVDGNGLRMPTVANDIIQVASEHVAA